MGANGSKPNNLYSEEDSQEDKNLSQRVVNLIDTNYDESDGENSDNKSNHKKENLNSKITQNLNTNQIKFHEVCGKNVLLQNNNQLAKRSQSSFCDAIVFSNRPIGVYERINVKILKLSSQWNGMVRFGFTSVNPETHRKNPSNQDDHIFDLPKYVYPNLTNKRGYWAGALAENSVKENDILYFYVNSSGEIHYGLNNIYKGQLLDGVEVYTRPQQAQPLWALFDIYGNTVGIEILNNPLDLNNNRVNQLQIQNDFDTISTMPSEFNNFRTLMNPPDSLESNRSLNSIGSSNSSSLSSSNLVTIIPNRRPPQSPGVVLRQNRPSNRNINNHRLSTSESLDQLFISFRRLCVDNHLNETLRNSIIDSNLDPGPQRKYIKNFYETIPVLLHEKTRNEENEKFLHKIHGKNVKICEPDFRIAYRESSIFQQQNKNLNLKKEPTRNGYVFMDKPLEKGKSLCLQIVGIDQSANEAIMSLGIGCTTCDPSRIREFPDEADELLDRPEYWIVYQNLFNAEIVTKKHHVAVADELCFLLDEKSGNLSFYVNGILITNCLFSVDTTQKLWFFFDLCGKINAVRLIKSCKNSRENSLDLETINQTNSRQRPNSALIDYYKSQLLPEPDADSKNKNNPVKKDPSIEDKKSNQEECRICLDAPIECVFYSCGHMCLCWNCATALKNQAKKTSSQGNTENKPNNPTCPICRVEIIDIIRFFKS